MEQRVLVSNRRVSLQDLPAINRFSPNCISASVEAVAQWQFGITNVSKAWFNHSFVYTPPTGEVELNTDGITLNVYFGCKPMVEPASEARLARQYGIQLVRVPCTDFESALADIHWALTRGEMTLSPFDLMFMQGRREYNVCHVPHMMVIVGLDLARGTLTAIDNIHLSGPFEMNLEDFAACFRYILAGGGPVLLVRGRRDPTHCELNLTPAEIGRDIGECLRNLRSTEPTQGLNALRQAVRMVELAHVRLDTPFAVPGMWMFVNERHSFRLNLMHWRESGLDTERLNALDTVLDTTFHAWFQAGAIVEASLEHQSKERQSALLPLLQRIVPMEERVATLLEGMIREHSLPLRT